MFSHEDAAHVRPHGAPTRPLAASSMVAADRLLLEGLLAGDQSAFKGLVTSHHGAMLRFARNFITKPDVAEEVVQETWLAVLGGLPAFEGRASLKTWIFHILANRARSRATRDARVVPFAELASSADDGSDADLEARFARNGRWSDSPAPWQADTPEAIFLRREAVVQLEAALELLPHTQRTVVTFRDIDGWSAQEVCDLLHISAANQRVLLPRARTRLRRTLECVLRRE